MAAWTLGIPQLTMFDYEYATVSHHLNVRLVDEIVVPEAIPLDRLAPYGAKPEKVFRYPGLKEEYYLYDFQPDADRSSSSSASTPGASSACCARRPT